MLKDQIIKKGFEYRIPKKFQNVSCDIPSDIEKDMVEQIKKGEGVYLFGESGVGKTYLFYAFSKNIIKQGYEVLILNTGIFLEELRLDFNKKYYGNEKSLFQEILDFKGILFFDDIGAEKSSDWTRERLYLILNKRDEDVLPTFFTSNLDLSSLAEQVGDRITSRISGITTRIELKGEDKRLKK